MPRQEIDKLVLDHCKSAIEHRLNWGQSEGWTHSDFQTLSEAILAQTGVSLSHNTLKRIWGKVKYDNSPTKATKDAVAVFAGYLHFEDARANWLKLHPEQESQENHELDESVLEQQNVSGSKAPKKAKSPNLLYLAVIGLLLAIAIAYQFLNNAASSKARIRFKATNGIVSTWPHTVNFEVDFTDAKADTIVVNYHDQIRMKASANVRRLNYTYFMPNFYKAKVFDGSDCLATQNIHIKTDGWVALGPLDTTLSYLPHRVIDTIQDSRLYIAPSQLMPRVPVMPEYYMSYRLVDDFALKLEDLDLSFEVKNDSKEGGLPCHDVRLRILGEENPLELMMLNKGCVDKAHFMIDGKGLNGRTADMTAFGHDFSRWQKVNVKASGKNFIASVADTTIGRLPISKSMGQIKGFIFWFKGTGSLKNFVVKNARTQAIIYRSEFK